MKLVALITMLFSLGAFAQALLPNPTDTLNLAMQKPLTFVGKYVSPTSQSGRISACIFRNADVTVVYEYCTKPEAPAVSVIIFDHASGGNTVQIYAEGTMAASRIRRDFYYDVFWRVAARKAPAGFTPTLTPQQMRGLEHDTEFADGCTVFYMEGMGELKRCADSIDSSEGSDAAHWLEAGAQFWDEPGDAWYAFQRHMRTLVDRTP